MNIEELPISLFLIVEGSSCSVVSNSKVFSSNESNNSGIVFSISTFEIFLLKEVYLFDSFLHCLSNPHLLDFWKNYIFAHSGHRAIRLSEISSSLMSIMTTS